MTDTDRTTRYDSAASPGGTGLATFDPFSAQIPDDPYPMYRELRDHAPVYRNDQRDFWALSRFEDVQWASRDWHVFTSADGVEQDRWGKLLRVSSFIGEDPPRHDQLRSILRKHFVPKQMHLLEATVEGITAALLRDAIDARHADLAADFGWPLGVSVVCEMLGLPEVDRSQMQQWLDQMLWRNPGDTEVPSVAIDTAKTVRDYFASVIASHRSQTDRDDVLSTLISAEGAGDLSRDELLDMCGLLFVAATDTVASAVSTLAPVTPVYPAHNPKVAGSNPAPAIQRSPANAGLFCGRSAPHRGVGWLDSYQFRDRRPRNHGGTSLLSL